jgi:hypothetical protein
VALWRRSTLCNALAMFDIFDTPTDNPAAELKGREASEFSNFTYL